MNYEKEIKTSILACKKATKIIMKNFGSNEDFIDKGNENIVSKTDIEAEKIILETLQKEFESDKYFGEENRFIKTNNKNKNSNRLWVIDPLDGTNNFAMEVPQIGISIALFEDNEIKFGIIYQPFLNKYIYAIKDEGVFVNNEKFKLNLDKNNGDKKEIISLLFGYKINSKIQGKIFYELSGEVKRILTQWSGALEYFQLIIGKTDAIISVKSEAEDQVAGLIMAKELGFVIKDLDGKNYFPKKFDEYLSTFIVAKNELTYNKIKNIVKEIL